MNKIYRTKCKNCGGVMEEVITSVYHPIKEIVIILINVPVFFCNTCKSTAYRKSLGIKELLKMAYSKSYNIIVFEDADYPDDIIVPD